MPIGQVCVLQLTLPSEHLGFRDTQLGNLLSIKVTNIKQDYHPSD